MVLVVTLIKAEGVLVKKRRNNHGERFPSAFSY